MNDSRRPDPVPRAWAAACLAAAVAGLAGCKTPGPAIDPPRVGGLGVSRGADCLPADVVRSVGVDLGFCLVQREGDTVRIAGMVADGPMDAAVDNAYAALARVLAAQGLAPSDVRKETLFATDLDALAAQKARREAFYGTTLPVTTLVQVQRLYLPTSVLELEITAQARR